MLNENTRLPENTRSNENTRLNEDARRPDGDDRGLSTRAVYVISVAAELAGVHPQTLRIYERKGLLEPQRTVGGNRRYSEADLAAMRRIQELTATGVNLEGVRRIIVLEREVQRLGRALDDARTEMRDAVAMTHRQYRRDLVPLRAARLPARRVTDRAF